MAQRYTQKKKDAVVAFVQQHNENKGRGGQAAAKKEFGINPITIRSWMENAGAVAPGKRAKKKGKKAIRTRAASKKTRASAGGGDLSASLLRMAAIQSELATLRAEYASLKEQI